MLFSRRGAENAEVTCVIWKNSIVLLIFLCVLCASARVNIYSFFYIDNPGCTG